MPTPFSALHNDDVCAQRFGLDGVLDRTTGGYADHAAFLESSN